jgi:hypothetical protein
VELAEESLEKKKEHCECRHGLANEAPANENRCQCRWCLPKSTQVTASVMKHTCHELTAPLVS